MARRRTKTFEEFKIEGEREYRYSELRKPDRDLMYWLGDFAARLIRDEDPEVADQVARAEKELLAFTQYTFPQYIADEFHKNVAEALTEFALPSVDYESDYLMLFAPPQHGKLIGHETPVLTTSGWKKHGELSPGDHVFGRDGRPAKVMALSQDGVADHAITFTDGSAIRCHGAHEWVVLNRSRHRPTEEIWETQEMLDRGVWIGERNSRGGTPRFNLPTIQIPTALKRKSIHAPNPAMRRRSIKAIKPCPPEPGRCIQVEGGVYLVGERLIPTHNSELVSTRLPGFWLAHNPDKPVAMVSYAAKLAERNSRNARAVVEDPRFFKIFAGRTIPDPENWRVYDWHIEDSPGYGLAVGVGGAITGHGFGLIIIDDPIESWAHAQSETIRESTWQWWQGTLKTRLWEDGKIILMMTRWHKDDLAGRILEHEGRIEEGGKWKVLSYPALSRQGDPKAEEPITDILGRDFGDPLAPSRFSKKYLEELKRDMTRLVWMAEYQQEPTDPEGTFFKVGRMEVLDEAPSDICRMHDEHPVDIQTGVRYWDLAATEKSMDVRDPDYVVGALVAESKRDRRFWVLDVVRGRMEPEQVAATVRQTAKMDGKKVKIRIEREPGASGKSLVAAYKHMLAGYDVDESPSSGEKTVKAQPFAAQVNAGNVVLLRGAWNRAFISELAGFPQVRHDDQVDASAGAFNEIVGEEGRWKSIKYLSV